MELLDRLGHASSRAEDGPARAADARSVGRPFRPPRPHRIRCPGANDLRRAPPSSSPAGRAGSARRSRSASPRSAPRRIAIGYMRGDQAAEETASELTALGVEPVLVRGNVASQRIADEVAALGPLDVLVHAAATGVIRPALETDDKHWDWTLSANARALLSLTRAAAPSMPSRLLDRRHLEPRLDSRARRLRARRSVEGRARGSRPLPRGRTRSARASA